MPLVGGLGGTKVADEIIKELLEKLSADIKSKIIETQSSVTAAAALELTPISYKTQIVAGTNFFVKIQIAENECIHARIYRPLQGDASVHSVTAVKELSDEVEYF